jgi:nicotinamide mononucleotide transporter
VHYYRLAVPQGLLEIIAALGRPAFSVLGVPVAWNELLGDVSGALCVWLLVRQSIWNWPLGLLNNVFWALSFYAARLYADAALQGIFFALGVYGLATWLRGAGRTGAELRVRRMRRSEWLLLSAASAVVTVAAAAALVRYTDSPVPGWDAGVLALSLAATYGQAQKLLESWWIWIAVDVISVPLYVSRGLYPTALLYAIFLALCVRGLQQWSRGLHAQEQPA